MSKFRVKPSVFIAGGIAALTAAWLYSGQIEANSPQTEVMAAVEPSTEQPSIETEEKPAFQVRVIESQSEARNIILPINGRTDFNRMVSLKSETDGRIREFPVDVGTIISAEDLMARLDIRDRQAQVEYLRALVAQRKLEDEAARKLAKKGFQSETRKAEAAANLEQAKASLRTAQINLNNTRINAPFDGVVYRNFVELGDFVQPGDPLLEIVDLDPLVITADIAETVVNRIVLGNTLDVSLSSGESLKAIVKRIIPVANEATRTFRIEAEVDNPDQAIRAGLTAKLSITLEARDAHFISKGLLTLNDAGQIGVKTVDATNHVVFKAVEMVQDTSDGVWISGLDDQERIISVGQEFVGDGQQVSPLLQGQEITSEEAPSPSSANTQVSASVTGEAS